MKYKTRCEFNTLEKKQENHRHGLFINYKPNDRRTRNNSNIKTYS